MYNPIDFIPSLLTCIVVGGFATIMIAVIEKIETIRIRKRGVF